MKISKKATSILEAIIVTMIVSMWTVWMYKIYMESNRLIDSTANRIQAIQIAREGIEAMTNIRDTNWIILWADLKNCWNTINYDAWCVWTTNATYRIRWWNTPSWSVKKWYTIYKDNDNRWKLKDYDIEAAIFNYDNSDFRNKFIVWLDNNWLYNQTWSLTNIKPLFTRYIKVLYKDTDWDSSASAVKDEKIEVFSIVEWRDKSSEKIHKVEFSTFLTNWKNKK